MSKFIDVLLLENGIFCKAPSHTVDEGDLVSLMDVLTGKPVIRKVIATAFSDPEGEIVKMVEKYIGFELPKIIQRFGAHDVVWEDEKDAVLQ